MHKLVLILLIFPVLVLSQNTISGTILEKNTVNKDLPLLGANVYWLNTTVGVVTDVDGKFTIPYKDNYKALVVSFVGFKSDTLMVSESKTIRHTLIPISNLDEVTVIAKREATSKLFLQAQNTMVVSNDELLKAACCNLSESFETNPSIDVNFADAISGTRQIKMLGLTSPYILIATENIPSVRGAAQTYGLSFVPGTWVESIQITKGAGSVVNGYESIAGQINAELQKPSRDDAFFLNLYGASSERLELNTHINKKVSAKWNTGLYLHGNTHNKKHDVNNDDFMDIPIYSQMNIMNRWQYTDNEKGFVSFFNFRYLNDEKQTGQMDFNPKKDKLTTNAWGSEINTERFDFSAKFGYVNPELPWQNLGVQFAISNHNQDSYFGINIYDIEHKSVYANINYSSIISDSRHKIKAGVNFTYDDYDELLSAMSFKRIDNSVGAFFEYAYDNLEKLTVTTGIRMDNHNRLGFFITPRVHARYSPWEKSAFRISFGRGKRIANIFAENQSIFGTARNINIKNAGGNVYGLNPEIAWNYGVSYLQGFNLFGRKANITFDYYKTDFINQIVVDWENPREINFYNLDGESYANSFQVEVNHNVFENFDVRLAYKLYNIKTQYEFEELEKPLIPKHRFFANASYATLGHEFIKKWKFDVTFNWLGQQRFSSTGSNPAQYQLPELTPAVATLNAQVTKVFSSKFEMYLGGENITNVQQKNPILGADDPFGANFDTTFVYGPIFGSMYYAGLRFKIK